MYAQTYGVIYDTARTKPSKKKHSKVGLLELCLSMVDAFRFCLTSFQEISLRAERVLVEAFDLLGSTSLKNFPIYSHTSRLETLGVD